jgi:putative SOS response-associated peptidase YedK
MCGRFTLFATPVEIGDLFAAPAPPELPPRYNVAPTQPVLACRLNAAAQARELVPLRWGVVASWAHDLAAGVKAINARAETVADKPTFRAAFKARRCLIPASGYYEWKHEGKAKQPYFIHPPHGELFAFAALWDVWAKGAAPVESCSIITTAANEATRHLHERMPVILDRDQFAAWLDPLTPPPVLHELLRPCPPERIATYPVAPLVGNVRNDGPELVAAITGRFTT